MLLREITEVQFLYELDGTNFQQAVDSAMGAVTRGQSKELKDDPSGTLPMEDVDVLLRPIIQLAIESSDPSATIIGQKVKNTLNTPDLKVTGSKGIDTALEFVNYLKVNFARDLDELPLIGTLRKATGSATMIQYVEEISSRDVPTDLLAGIAQAVTKHKNVFVEAVMKRAAADSFRKSVVKDFEKDLNDISGAPKDKAAGMQAKLKKSLDSYVGYLSIMKKNLEMTRRLIQPDREEDTDDASA